MLRYIKHDVTVLKIATARHLGLVKFEFFNGRGG